MQPLIQKRRIFPVVTMIVKGIVPSDLGLHFDIPKCNEIDDDQDHRYLTRKIFLITILIRDLKHANVVQ